MLVLFNGCYFINVGMDEFGSVRSIVLPLLRDWAVMDGADVAA